MSLSKYRTICISVCMLYYTYQSICTYYIKRSKSVLRSCMEKFPTVLRARKKWCLCFSVPANLKGTLKIGTSTFSSAEGLRKRKKCLSSSVKHYDFLTNAPSSFRKFLDRNKYLRWLSNSDRFTKFRILMEKFLFHFLQKSIDVPFIHIPRKILLTSILPLNQSVFKTITPNHLQVANIY